MKRTLTRLALALLPVFPVAGATVTYQQPDSLYSTFTVVGATPLIDDWYYFDLADHPSYGQRSVTILSGTPLIGFSAYFDNSPFSTGTGMCLRTEAEEIGCAGAGSAFEGWFGFHSAIPFTSITLYTNQPFQEFLMERGVFSQLRGTPVTPMEPLEPLSSVPEPSSLALIGAGMVGLGVASKLRGSRRIQRTREC